MRGRDELDGLPDAIRGEDLEPIVRELLRQELPARRLVLHHQDRFPRHSGEATTACGRRTDVLSDEIVPSARHSSPTDAAYHPVVRYMVVEHFVRGARPVYERAAASGRLLPPGLLYLDSWVDEGLECCFQLMETDDPALLDRWTAEWSDLVTFEVVPLIDSAEAAARALGGDAAA